MEHRWGGRLTANIPVRLRCLQSPDSGCRCLGCLENVSASGALLRTELGIHPADSIAIETLPTAPGERPSELAACVVRSGAGEMAIEWQDFAGSDVLALLAETLLASATADRKGAAPALGRVPFCALAPMTAA